MKRNIYKQLNSVPSFTVPSDHQFKLGLNYFKLETLHFFTKIEAGT